VLAKFPPTLIVTGTRGFELSSAVYTHAQLVKQGVEADLHVCESMFHGFFYNVDVPESRDCYDVIVRFFERHLGRPAQPPAL
jgi:acetyl esterase/lipase